MAVTPTEVLLLEMRMARVVYMRDVSNRMSQVYVEVLSSQLQHQTTNEETSVNTSVPSVGGGGFNRLCGWANLTSKCRGLTDSQTQILASFANLLPPAPQMIFFSLLILFEFLQTRLCLTSFCLLVCLFCSLLHKNLRERCYLLPSYNAVNYASRR